MKVVLLMGGAGNRLFQIARAWDLKAAGHDPILVPVEAVPEIDWFASRFLGWTRHRHWADMDLLAREMGMTRRDLSASARLAILAELVLTRLPGGKARFNLPLDADDRTAQIGYFQGDGCLSPASVAAVSDALADMLPLSGHPAHAAVVHIRGGDFAQEDRLSAAEVHRFSSATGGMCMGVTNDPAYVNAHFPALSLAPSTGALDDFCTLCKAQTIMPSNSTFCFWACTIATRRSGAKLWLRPPDSYWNLLDPSAWHPEALNGQGVATRGV